VHSFSSWTNCVNFANLTVAFVCSCNTFCGVQKDCKDKLRSFFVFERASRRKVVAGEVVELAWIGHGPREARNPKMVSGDRTHPCEVRQ